MKNIKTLILTFIIGLFLAGGVMEQVAEAQPSKVPAGGPFLHVRPKGACRLDPSITFTEEQIKKLENLGRAFLEEARPLSGELRDLRLELRYAVSDPQAQSQVLLDKQRKMSAIQAKLENLRFSYLTKARAIFTREQLERFPADCPLKMGTEYGVGRGPGKGPRIGIRP
jgi:Spy/CpxP family protein refolding chaperone